MKESIGLFKHAQPAVELQQAVAELRQCLETVLTDVAAVLDAPVVVPPTANR